MTDQRPRVAPDLLAELLDAAPSRVRRKLDAAPRTADDWEWTATAEGWTVLAGTETVTLAAPELTEPGQVACTCLLGPRCLHLLAAVSLLDPLGADPGPALTEPGTSGAPAPTDPPSDSPATPQDPGPTTPGVPANPGATTPPPASANPGTSPKPSAVRPDPLSAPVEIDDAARTAARAAWSAGARVLASGVRAGAAHRSDLLRASALARTARLPRLAAACATVAAGPRDHDTHHFALGEYTAALTALLDVSRRLGGGPDGARPAPTLADVGVGRRSYTEIGSLRLYGLGTERVVTASGHAGVVTHLVSFDGDGGPSFWSVGDVVPGEGARADQAYAARVNFGGTSRSHHELGRSGLIAQRVRASADGRLGSGAATTAAGTDSTPWDAGPVASLWNRPVGEQISSALAAQTAPARRTGSDLVFVELTVIGPAVGTEGVAVAETSTGRVLRLAAGGAQDTHRAHNLALLARSEGTRVRTVARLLPERPGTLVPLTVELRGGPALPEPLKGRANLSLDTLPSPGAVRSQETGRHQAGDAVARSGKRPGPDTGLNGLERALARVAEAGREAVPSAGTLAGRLRSHHLPTGAELLAGVGAAGRERVRTATGESVPPPPDALAAAWLAAVTYAASVRAHLNALAWEDPF
ncbi:hypothetical protein [Nocardiopsis ganjiahuensis]|uniref:hypothetical protein n=1 Tax=Nocardiopsis ganjiahuensis TaxID=239984 RepID=UPI0003448ACA|nr:hypothetical protein [Nocardiopsis ganjiahuensis]